MGVFGGTGGGMLLRGETCSPLIRGEACCCDGGRLYSWLGRKLETSPLECRVGETGMLSCGVG